MSEFKNVTIVRKANVYFDGKVTGRKVIFADGSKMTVGIMLAGEGLHPTSKGKRVQYTGKQTAVIDGPFAETKELVAGFWIWQVRSMEEAVEWARRAPMGGGEVEIRPVFEAADFGDAFTPELQEQEARLREQITAAATQSS